MLLYFVVKMAAVFLQSAKVIEFVSSRNKALLMVKRCNICFL